MNSTKIVIDAPKKTLNGGIGATMARIRELYCMGTAFAKINKKGDYHATGVIGENPTTRKVIN